MGSQDSSDSRSQRAPLKRLPQRQTKGRRPGPRGPTGVHTPPINTPSRSHVRLSCETQTFVKARIGAADGWLFCQETCGIGGHGGAEWAVALLSPRPVAAQATEGILIASYHCLVSLSCGKRRAQGAYPVRAIEAGALAGAEVGGGGVGRLAKGRRPDDGDGQPSGRPARCTVLPYNRGPFTTHSGLEM